MGQSIQPPVPDLISAAQVHLYGAYPQLRVRHESVVQRQRMNIQKRSAESTPALEIVPKLFGDVDGSAESVLPLRKWSWQCVEIVSTFDAFRSGRNRLALFVGCFGYVHGGLRQFPYQG